MVLSLSEVSEGGGTIGAIDSVREERITKSEGDAVNAQSSDSCGDGLTDTTGPISDGFSDSSRTVMKNEEDDRIALKNSKRRRSFSSLFEKTIKPPSPQSSGSNTPTKNHGKIQNSSSSPNSSSSSSAEHESSMDSSLNKKSTGSGAPTTPRGAKFGISLSKSNSGARDIPLNAKKYNGSPIGGSQTNRGSSASTSEPSGQSGPYRIYEKEGGGGGGVLASIGQRLGRDRTQSMPSSKDKRYTTQSTDSIPSYNYSEETTSLSVSRQTSTNTYMKNNGNPFDDTESMSMSSTGYDDNENTHGRRQSGNPFDDEDDEPRIPTDRTTQTTTEELSYSTDIHTEPEINHYRKVIFIIFFCDLFFS